MTIRAQSVSYRAQGNTLLSAISVTLEAGQITSIIGPGRANKTALMQCLSGQNQPTSGTVSIASPASVQWSDGAPPRPLISIPPITASSGQLSVHQFVQSKRYPQMSAQPLANGLRDCLFELYHDFDLFNLLNRKLHQLSEEELRRTRLTWALYQTWLLAHAGLQRAFLLLDEAFSRLHFMHELKALSYVRELSLRGVGVGIILDDLNLAARFSDQLILLNQDRLVACGSAACVLNPTILSTVYQHPITVEYHKSLQRLLVQLQPLEPSATGLSPLPF